MKVQSSIDGIKISPRERRGHPHVQIVGGLAAILDLAVSRKQKTAVQKMAVLAGFWWLRGQDLLKTLRLENGCEIAAMLSNCHYLGLN